MVKKLTIIILCLLVAAVAAVAVVLGLTSGSSDSGTSTGDASQSGETTSGGNTSQSGGSTSGGNTSQSGGSASGGNTSQSGGSTSGGNTSQSGGSTSGGNTSQSGGSTSGGNTSQDGGMVNAPEVHVCSYVFSYTVPADCINGGYDVYECACGNTENRNLTKALGHDYKDTIHSATCSQDWSMTSVCTRCNDTQTQTVADSKLPHDYVWTETLTATCTSEGLKTGVCKWCGVTVTEDVPVIAHNYGAYISNNDATCEHDETMTATCVDCGHEDIQTVANSKLPHVYGTYLYNDDATCIHDGTKTATCVNCGATDTVTASGTATGVHSYSAWIETAGTCIEEGTRSRTCIWCGDVQCESTGHYGEHVANGIGENCNYCGQPVYYMGHDYYDTEEYGSIWFAYVIKSLTDNLLTCDIYIVQYDFDDLNQTVTAVGTPISLNDVQITNIWQEGEYEDVGISDLWPNFEIELLHLATNSLRQFKLYINFELNEDEMSLLIHTAFTQKIGDNHVAIFEPMWYIEKLSQTDESLGDYSH